MSDSSGDRVLTEDIAKYSKSGFAEDVRAGLTKPGQKELPSRYFYDDIGSALFDVISLLPEYGLTRAGERLLKKHADDIVGRIPEAAIVAELGSGTGGKTRLILDAFRHRQPIVYYPIEISPSALARCRLELGDMDHVRIVGLEKEYLDGLVEVSARRRVGEHILLLFLGSTIGNFDRKPGRQFLREVRRILSPGDGFLLAADLVQNTETVLAAYDDSIGVTAAFNLNLLARINRELDANFELSQFRHLVRYRSDERRIEMHLRSTVEQTVTISGASCSVRFEKDETIWTESSHKFTSEEIVQIAGETGFRCDSQWLDQEWPFSQSLFIAR